MGSAPRSVSVRPALRWVVGNPVRVTSATSNKRAVDLATDGICARVGGSQVGRLTPPGWVSAAAGGQGCSGGRLTFQIRRPQ